ncbi:MAG: ATP-binding protein [Myxococcota bacterium]|nr:ATP-binding protein [Myxococcota bacterium]
MSTNTPKSLDTPEAQAQPEDRPRGVWASLIEPTASNLSAAERRKSRMLASILVITFPIAIFALSVRVMLQPSYLPVFKVVMLCIGPFTVFPYYMARKGIWRAGTFTYLLGTEALILFSMMTDVDSESRFRNSLIVVLAAALLLEMKDTAIIVALSVVGLLLIATVVDPSDVVLVYTSINYLLFASAIILVTQHYRAQLERDRAQDLEEREARQRRLLEATFDGIATVEEGIIQEANSGFSALFGLETKGMLGQRLSSFMSEEQQQQTEDILSSSEQCIQELVGRRPNRHPVYIEVLFEPLVGSSNRHLLAIRDNTERKELQASLQVADRMAAIGSLAAGVAHEINNPLTYVLANLEEASNRIAHLDSTDLEANLQKANQCLHIASEGAGRVQRTIQDLKTLSRSDDEPILPVDVQEVLDSTIGIALNTVRHRGKLNTSHEQTRSALANKSRLGQVFLNLIINASESLPEDQNLQIYIDSYETKEHIVVEVRDTGSGIPTEQLDRIFDPYYTTKPVGVGTGLGLWVSRNLLHNMGGEIEVESTVGEGSLFRVKLKATNERPPPPQDTPLSAPRLDIKANILIVDDEPAIVDLVSDILLPYHQVSGAGGGTIAMKRILEEKFDLVICDLMMPDLSGMDLYEKLMEAQPQDIPLFLFLTGGAVNNKSREFVNDPAHTVLQKPFQPKSLRNAVQDLLSKS